MQIPSQLPSEPGHPTPLRSLWPWLVVAVLLIAAVAIFLPRPKREAPSKPGANTPGSRWKATITASKYSRAVPQRWHVAPGLTAEEIVTNKLGQFVHNRRELLHRMAEQFKVPVPAKYEHFFDIVNAGDWGQVTNAFNALRDNRDSEADQTLWPVLTETYGVASAVHDWPAQQLLDYGQAVLGSLRPDMVYVGGTDAGRFIPTLLNETSDGDRHIVLTQNALADGSYLQYLRFLYGDQLNALAGEDSQKAFTDYTGDLEKRWLHDQQFPDEPKQLWPGENFQKTNDRVQISGQMAVMAINENLFQMLMVKNPNLSFAIEESFPFKSTYADATVLGPIMELGVKDAQNALTLQRASESVDYWRAASLQLLSDLALNDSREVRQEWSKMAISQARLLLERNYAVNAEETFRIADQICPWSPEVVFNYVQLLMQQGRPQEAIPIVENALKTAPGSDSTETFNKVLQQLKQVKKN